MDARVAGLADGFLLRGSLPMYALLADTISLIHLAYVACVVVGQLAIVVGYFAQWGWIRNLRFRVVHLAMIGIVAFEAILGVTCPLTTWEQGLRQAAGQQAHAESFVSRLVNAFIVHDWPQWTFTVLHVGFALLVLVTLVLIPPRPRSSRLADCN